jgi:hypothetical protein
MADLTMITNATGTQSILSAQKVIDIADKIYLLEPNAAPLYVLVSKLNKKVAINTKYSWLEDDLNPTWSTFAVSAVSSATALTGYNDAESAYFNKFDLIKIPRTGEVILIQSISGSAFTVLRGYGKDSSGASAQAISTSDAFFRIGTAFQEGSPYSDLVTKSTQTVEVANYLQIFRTSVEITKSLANTELYGGADRPYQRKKKGIELMRDLERAFLFGYPVEDNRSATVSQGHARRTTGGVDYFVATNSTNMGGVMTESEFETFLRTIFRYGSTTRYLFCAPLILSVVSQWAQGKLQMFPKDKTYGIAITQYLSPHGSINLVKDVILEHFAAGYPAAWGSTSYYGGYAYALELENLAYRYLQNRDVQMETDIQLPGDDSYKDQYICEVGLEFRQERTMGKVYGVTG